jgi:hypothetical protein
MKIKSDLIYSTLVGTSIGFAAGTGMGVIQLLYVPELAAWTYGSIIVGICALGWAGYGAIAGGAGIFKRAKQAEHGAEAGRTAVVGLAKPL